MAGKKRFIYSGLGIGGQGICDQEASGGLHHKDGGVRSQQQVDIGTIGLDGGFGTHDDSKYHCRLGRLLARCNSKSYFRLGNRTLACHMVMDVAVMTANICPRRETRSARMGSLSGNSAGWGPLAEEVCGGES